MAKAKKFFLPFLILFPLVLSASAIDPQSVTELAPMGHTTGIKMFCDGVMVVDTAQVETDSGAADPAKAAGIAPGDVIVKLGGEHIHSNEQFKAIVEKAKGAPIAVELKRNDEKIKVSLTPIKDSQGEYKAGLWIRDSMAGIGTFTFYDPQNKLFGALGHGICDSETNTLVPFASGSVMESKVVEVKKGKAGEPGELIGEYNLSEDSGELSDNTNSGIFGKLSDKKLTKNLKCIPIGRKNQVHTGAAEILSNIQGDKVESYTIEITRIFPEQEQDTKNMMIRVTDKKLIEKTGGIVQGMSGSPIIQDGRLIGAVTHV